MEVILLSINETKNPYLEKLIIDYSKRINHYIKFTNIEIQKIKSSRKNNIEEQKNKEGIQIKKFLKKSDICVLLDETGRSLNSVEFAKSLNNYYCSNKKRVVFIIGGAFGFSKEIYSIIFEKFSLSKMTFNHQMLKLFFCEQLYRANTILKNEKYHNK